MAQGFSAAASFSVYWRSLCFDLMNERSLQFHLLFSKNLAFHVQVSYSLSITRESDTLIIILWISQYSQTILLIQIPIKMHWRVILILCLLRRTSPKKYLFFWESHKLEEIPAHLLTLFHLRGVPIRAVDTLRRQGEKRRLRRRLFSRRL